MNCLAVGLARNASVSQNRPLTVTSMASSGISLQVARCTTWLTPSMARSTLSRSAIVPFTTSSPGAAGSVRLWQRARMMRSGRGDKLSRRIRFDPTFPVAPVIRSFILVLPPRWVRHAFRQWLLRPVGGGSLAADPDIVLRVAGGIVRIAAGIVRAVVHLSGGIDRLIGVAAGEHKRHKSQKDRDPHSRPPGSMEAGAQASVAQSAIGLKCS